MLNLHFLQMFRQSYFIISSGATFSSLTILLLLLFFVMEYNPHACHTHTYTNTKTHNNNSIQNRIQETIPSKNTLYAFKRTFAMPSNKFDNPFLFKAIEKQNNEKQKSLITKITTTTASIMHLHQSTTISTKKNTHTHKSKLYVYESNTFITKWISYGFPNIGHWFQIFNMFFFSKKKN